MRPSACQGWRGKPLTLLTPELMTESEIDYEVNGLLAELEQFRKAAKAELSSLRLKMLER